MNSYFEKPLLQDSDQFVQSSFQASISKKVH